MRTLCKTCPENPKKRRKVHPYVEALYRVMVLSDAGYPWMPDDLPLQMWMDMAMLKQRILARRGL